MPVLVHTPGTPPPTPLPPVERYEWRRHFPGMSGVTWTGWDETEWELGGCGGNGMSGVALGRRLRGLHFGELEEWATESPAMDGAAYQGFRAKSREVFLTLRVYHHAGSAEWVEYDRRFWRSMLPANPSIGRGPGHLTVTAPDGSRRWLELYPRHTGDHDFEVDPSRKGWGVYGQYLTAYRPYWTSDPIKSARFQQGGATSFFGGAKGGYGPPFVIGAGASFASAQISNPGDESAYPVWDLWGPFTEVSIGVPGQQTTIKHTVAAGQRLRVVTDPLEQTITDQDGRVVIPTMLGGAPFAMIPPGDAVPLATAMVGTGRIEVSLQPRYHRAW